MVTKPLVRIRRSIVMTLEWTCGVVDDLPGIWRDDDGIRFVRHAQYGCWPLRLAQLSANLDEKWRTNAWGSSAGVKQNMPIEVDDEGYINLDEEVIIRKDGTRLTEAKAARLGKEIAHRIRMRRQRRSD